MSALQKVVDATKEFVVNNAATAVATMGSTGGIATVVSVGVVGYTTATVVQDTNPKSSTPTETAAIVETVDERLLTPESALNDNSDIDLGGSEGFDVDAGLEANIPNQTANNSGNGANNPAAANSNAGAATDTDKAAKSNNAGGLLAWVANNIANAVKGAQSGDSSATSSESGGDSTEASSDSEKSKEKTASTDGESEDGSADGESTSDSDETSTADADSTDSDTENTASTDENDSDSESSDSDSFEEAEEVADSSEDSSSDSSSSDSILDAIASIFDFTSDDSSNTSSDSSSSDSSSSSSSSATLAISSISPAIGPEAGGTIITITGTEFEIGMTVTFANGDNCGSIAIVSSTKLTCETPAISAGSYDISVQDTSGTTASYSSFRFYITPLIDSVTPADGTSDGGTLITILGSNFEDGLSIDLGGSICESITFVSSTQLSCITTSHAFGDVNVNINNPSGGSDVFKDGFAYRAKPSVRGISSVAGSPIMGTSKSASSSSFTAKETVIQLF